MVKKTKWKNKMKEKSEIFGIHPVIEALKSGENIDKIFLIKDLKNDVRREVLQLASERNIPVQFVPVEKLKRIVNNVAHQGIVASISPIEFDDIENLVPWWYENAVTPVIVVLDEITDIGNFGAIARTVECSGANAIIVPWRNSAQINAQTIKASAGALYNIPVCRTNNIIDTLKFLKQSGIKIISCTEKASDNYTDVSYVEPVAIVMGSEEYGISKDVLKVSDDLVKISMFGNIKSLNVSVATGVILYEIVRQRNVD